jgi:hypothetical protein
LTCADAANYVLTADTVSGNDGVITPRALTLDAGKVYDGTTALEFVALGNLVAGEYLNYSDATAASKHVGGPDDDIATDDNYIKTIILSNVIDGGNAVFKTSNYSLPGGADGVVSGVENTLDRSDNNTATITAAQLAVRLDAEQISKVYDGTTAGIGQPGYVVTGLVAGDSAFTLTQTGSAFNAANVKDASTYTVSGISVSGIVGGSRASDYVLDTNTLTVAGNITARAVQVDVDAGINKIYDTTTDFQNLNIKLDNVVAADESNVTIRAAGGSFDGKNAGSGKSYTLTGLVLEGTAADNYQLVSGGSISGINGVIEKKKLDVNDLATISKVYDGTTSANTSAVDANASIASGATSAQDGKVYNGDQVSLQKGTVTGAFEDKHAEDNKTVKLSGFVLTGDDAGNYEIVDATTSGNISKATISGVTGVVADNKTYDGKADATLNYSGAHLTGMVAGDALTISDVTGAFTNVNAGDGKDVRLNVILDGADARNYEFAYGDIYTTANITKRDVNVTQASAANKVYNGNQHATVTAGVLSGLVDGESLTVLASGSFTGKDAANGVVVNTVSTLDDGVGGLAGNYNLVNATGSTTANISKAVITNVTGITASNKTYDGKTTAIIDGSQAVFTGMVDGDVLTVATGNGAFADKNVGQDKNVIITDITLGGDDANNYTLAPATNTASADITRLDSVEWVGGNSGNWFDPANWKDGAVPDLSNVANVVIPDGVTVTFDTSGVVTPAETGPVHIDRLGDNGTLVMNDGALHVGGGGITLDGMAQHGGTLTSEGDITLGSFVQTNGSTSTNGDLHVDTHFSQGPNGQVTVDGNANITNTDGDTVLGNLDIAGDLDVTSTDGDVTQATGTTIEVDGSTTINAGNNDITLDGPNNDFAGPVNGSGGNITLVDGNGGIILGDIDAQGDLDVTSTDGDVTQATGTTIEVDGSTTINAGNNDIILDGPNNDFAGPVNGSGGNITLVDGNGGIIIGNIDAQGDLDVVSTDGDVTQAPGTTVQVDGSTTINAGNNDITLDGPNNDFAGPVNGSGGNITLVDGNGGIILGYIDAQGDLDVVSTDGGVKQAQGTTIEVDGSTTINAGNNDITLDGPNNDFAGPVNGSGGNITLVDGNGGIILGDIDAQGDLDVVSTDGDVTQAPGTTVHVDGSTTINAGNNDITLDGPNNDFAGPVNGSGGNITLVDGNGGITIGNIDAQGDLDVVSTDGDVIQAPGTTVHVDGSTTINAGNNNITLDGPNNDFAGPVNGSGGNITLVDGNGGIILGDLDAQGDLNVTSTDGDITQASDTHLAVGGDAEFNAPGHTVVLSSPDNQFGGNVIIHDGGGADISTPQVVVIPPVMALPNLPTPDNAPPAIAELSLGDQGGLVLTSGLAVGDGITVQVMSELSVQGERQIRVEVPQKMLVTGFGFMLPQQLTDGVPAGTVITATLQDGRALPAWITFDSARRRFTSEAVPSGGLPLQVKINLGGQTVTMIISMAQSNTLLDI